MPYAALFTWRCCPVVAENTSTSTSLIPVPYAAGAVATDRSMAQPLYVVESAAIPSVSDPEKTRPV